MLGDKWVDGQSVAVTVIEPDWCLRCKRDLGEVLQFVLVMTHPEGYVWRLCLDCWNEVVLQDANAREVELSAISPDGTVKKVRGW